jgi:[protein-PII] uridylyltransferase
MILVATPRVSALAVTQGLPSDPVKPTALGALARDFVRGARAEMRERHEAGMGGLAGVAAYTEAIDRLTGFIFHSAEVYAAGRNPRLHERFTLVAQGGYGRGELNAFSDIDLLFLYPWKVTPHIETVIEIVLYSLWDAGLSVGHAVRNERECLRMAATDFKVKTALLDARHLCGDQPLFAEFDDTMLRELWTADQTRFIRDKLAESTSRHGRTGRSVRLLQPELKEGQGGLRDLHTAMWMAKTRFRVRSFRQLVPLGVVSEDDILALESALDFLWWLRNMMHFAVGGHEDRLTFELQDRLSVVMGFGEGREGLERFMRTYYRHASQVHRLSERVIERCSRPTAPARHGRPPLRMIQDGMRVRGTQLSVSGRAVFDGRPAALAEIFLQAQRHGVRLSAGTRQLVAEVAANHPPLVGADVAAAMRGIVSGRALVADTLESMHELGVLRLVLPEFAHLDCLVSHDPYHTYTVDEHTLLAVREIERLANGEFSDERTLLSQVVRDVPQLELLYLGMLCHDVGKGHGDDHSGRGVPKMEAIAARLGLDEDETATCTFLVRQHLYMSFLAQRRDIRDDALVADFCRTVGSVENLQYLFVMTYADMRAVAPGVWNEWRGGLVTELYLRALERLERGSFVIGDRAAQAARVRQRAVERADASSAAAVRAFVGDMPDGYFLTTPENRIAGHAALLAQFRKAQDGAGAFACAYTVYRHQQLAELAVCTADRPGLFSTLAGVLASHGMNVLGARITTTESGVVLDSFRIDWTRGLEREPWERFEATLGRVLRGEVSVASLVGEAPAPRRRTGRKRAATVGIDNEVSETCTVIDVEASDRVGLLYTITRCLFRLGLSVHLAKINTMAERVLDVLYVAEADGRKVASPERLRQIETELRAAVDPESAAAPERMAGQSG